VGSEGVSVTLSRLWDWDPSPLQGGARRPSCCDSALYEHSASVSDQQFCFNLLGQHYLGTRTADHNRHDDRPYVRLFPIVSFEMLLWNTRSPTL
jgi:hypothetical protein